MPAQSISSLTVEIDTPGPATATHGCASQNGPEVQDKSRSQSTALGHKIMVQASYARDVMLDRYIYETRKTELHINEILMVKNTNI
ncbi:hypothetical protein X797_009354 [Metarhizium robertsii]|uniref:Uncharacterized protein n=1 Tax=Metarhizium robertsii TaxID=568076 RepID=A0A014PLD5_9HYPO|nr:hypothetical protein X797_009354 [Metarhizium robertsii]